MGFVVSFRRGQRLQKHDSPASERGTTGYGSGRFWDSGTCNHGRD